MSELVVISLFSGAMGLDLGLERAGFKIKVAVECDSHAVRTIKANRPDVHVISRDIRTVSADEILLAAGVKKGQITLVAGGPCCQAFSVAGKRGSLSDPRGTLFTHFIRIVNDLKPDYFLMENVKGLETAAIIHRPLKERHPDAPPLSEDEVHGSAFALVLSELKKLGGHVNVERVNASDHGAPQSRERLLILGSPKGYPLPDISGGVKKKKTLGDVLFGFNEQTPICASISPKIARYVPMIPAGGNWKALPKAMQKDAIGEGAYQSWGGRTGFLRRLSWDKPCPTLICSPASRATMLIHPEEDRVLSVGEYRHIQGFPDEWVFHGGMTNQYRQIGNAVPLSLGESVGISLKECAMKKTNCINKNKNSAHIFTRSNRFYARLCKMKVSTIEPNFFSEYGSKKVYSWLSRAGVGTRPSDLIHIEV